MPESPDTRQNSDRGISDFRTSGQSLTKENYHNSRNCDDIDMKLGPETKLDKRNKTTSKKFANNVITSFFYFMANLEQSKSQMPDAWSGKLTFLLIVTF